MKKNKAQVAPSNSSRLEPTSADRQRLKDLNIGRFLERRHSNLNDERKALLAASGKVSVEFSREMISFQIAAAIVYACDVVVQASNSDKSLKIWDPSVHYHVDIDKRLDYIIVTLSETMQIKHELKRLKQDVKSIICSGARIFADEVDDYRPAPRGLILLPDGVFDCKQDRYISQIVSDCYHHSFRIDFKRDRNGVDQVHQAILNRIFDDWSGGNAENRQLLLDYLRCVVEGDNRGRALAISGSGGNGKSAYITMASALIRSESVMYLNIHDAENGFMLEDLSSETVLIAGDELRSNYRFGGESLARYKQIIDGQPIKINPKGKQAKVILPRVCIIQSMNTKMVFSEANNANKDRWIYYIWPSINFRAKRRKGEVDFDLNALIRDRAFIQSLFNYIFDNTEYFTEIHVPNMVVDETDRLIDESDNVKLFVEHMVEMNIIGKDPFIPSQVMYEAFQVWLKNESPSARVMGRRLFTDRLKTEMSLFGYDTTKNDQGKAKAIRYSSLSMIEWDRFNASIVTGIDYLDESFIKKLSPCVFFSNESLLISGERQLSLISKITDSDDVDVHDEQINRMIKHMIYDKHDPLITSKFKDQL